MNALQSICLPKCANIVRQLSHAMYDTNSSNNMDDIEKVHDILAFPTGMVGYSKSLTSHSTQYRSFQRREALSSDVHLSFSNGGPAT